MIPLALLLRFFFGRECLVDLNEFCGLIKRYLIYSSCWKSWRLIHSIITYVFVKFTGTVVRLSIVIKTVQCRKNRLKLKSGKSFYLPLFFQLRSWSFVNFNLRDLKHLSHVSIDSRSFLKKNQERDIPVEHWHNF